LFSLADAPPSSGCQFRASWGHRGWAQAAGGFFSVVTAPAAITALRSTQPSGQADAPAPCFRMVRTRSGGGIPHVIHDHILRTASRRGSARLARRKKAGCLEFFRQPRSQKGVQPQWRHGGGDVVQIGNAFREWQGTSGGKRENNPAQWQGTVCGWSTMVTHTMASSMVAGLAAAATILSTSCFWPGAGRHKHAWNLVAVLDAARWRGALVIVFASRTPYV